MIFQYALRTEAGLQVVDSDGQVVVYDRYSLADSATHYRSGLFVHGDMRNGGFARKIDPIPPGHRLHVISHGIDWSRSLQPLPGPQRLVDADREKQREEIRAALETQPKRQSKAEPLPAPGPIGGDCPACHATPGTPCRSKTTGKPTAPTRPILTATPGIVEHDANEVPLIRVSINDGDVFDGGAAQPATNISVVPKVPKLRALAG